MKNILFVIFLLSLSYNSLIAQRQIIDENLHQKNVLSINVLGVSPGIGLVYERFLTQKISVEVGLGGNFWKNFDDIWGVGLGMKIYPFYQKINQYKFILDSLLYCINTLEINCTILIICQ